MRYSPEEEPVTVSFGRRPGAVQVTVADRGVGIPEELREKVFTPFFRGRQKGIEHVPGSGLGLSISKEIVEAHGGRIWFESAPDGGSRFHFTLPA